MRRAANIKRSAIDYSSLQPFCAADATIFFSYVKWPGDSENKVQKIFYGYTKITFFSRLLCFFHFIMLFQF